MSVEVETRSGPLGVPPLIGPSEQLLFAIEDTRERADRLQELLVPKLELLLDEACDLLREVYGTESLLHIRMPTTPSHRPGAKQTKAFELATAGLAVEGQAWFFQQRFECTSDNLHVIFFGLRGLEGNPIVQVMKKHQERIIRLLEHDEFEVRSSALGPSDEVEDLNLADFIGNLRLMPEREWNGTSIKGPPIALPIEDLDAAWPLLYDFVALFPIFRAATDVLRGEDDRFEYYSERFWNWQARLEEPDSDEDPSDDVPTSNSGPASPPPSETQTEANESGLLEGELKVALRRHRLREKRLRKWKIREVLRVENGRLRCEVPGCGFDFFEVYGELGREFAHIHHKEPLSARPGPERTKLDDLAIVCANCHAMIHKGGACRTLEDLMPRRE